jgi:hypothetical protein
VKGNQHATQSIGPAVKEVFFNDFEDPIADYLDSISSINVQILLSDESGLCHLFKLHSCMLWFPIFLGQDQGCYISKSVSDMAALEI